ncbi:acyl-CoA dehydrogenase family protein [Caldiplasma sukawensis]
MFAIDQSFYDELRKNVRSFVKEKVEPIRKKIDLEDYFPKDVFRQMGNQGYLGATVSEEYGGSGIGYLGQAIIEEELGYSSPGLALSYGAHSNLMVDNLFRNGNETQKNMYLPDLCSGKSIGSLALTEPGSGSDALNMKTTAEKKGDHYIIKGSKTYITNAPYADVIIAYAKTEDDYTAFLLRSDDEGFSRGKKFDKMGMRGSPTGELYFDSIKVGDDRILGKYKGGKDIILGGLNVERAMLSFIFVGIARRAINESISYSIERKQFSKSLYEFEMIQDKLATMYTEYRAARLLAYDALQKVEENKMNVKDAAASILYSAIISERVAREAIQIHGGYGYIHDSGINMLLRDAILGQIGAGTTEIRKRLISNSLVKEFRQGKEVE